MENKITAICQDCSKQFDYVLKPGFPRKYCFECSEKKKASFNDMQQPEVVKPGVEPVRKSVKGTAYEKDPVGLAVEVFCAIVQHGLPANQGVGTMNLAVERVKQAQEAFR